MNNSPFNARGLRPAGLLLAAAVVVVLISRAFSLLGQQPSPLPTSSASPAATHMTPSNDHPADSAASRPSNEELRKKLTPEQYAVTCEAATEPAFRNAYWNNHEPGIYVDVITGKALFSSSDKFDSGTGWPSFTKPIEKREIVEKTDGSLGMERNEVRSSSSDAHLGHVFDDGPASAGGMRFCINSASLRFIPVSKLKEEGFAQYLPLFEKGK